MIPLLHIITDDDILSQKGFLDGAQSLMAAGKGKVVFHLRGPGLGGRRIYELAQALKKPAKKSGALFLVNDRVDVALALDLPGVHLSQRSLPPVEARALIGHDKVLGVSTHVVREAVEAERGSGEFLLVGTLFATPSHPDGEPGGVERMDEVSPATSLPLIGIGGITPSRVREVMEVGGHGVAVRSGIWEADDPVEAVGTFLEEIEGFRKSE
jgi:thiamine-phosphate diphosphorylase